MVVFRSWTLRRNLWWNEVPGERIIHYQYGRKILEERGWTFTGAVIDGRRGLSNVFKDIPVQMCHFHQLQTVTKYLTSKPRTEAGKELRSLALTLARTNEEVFTKVLNAWEKKHHSFIQRRPTYLERSIGTIRTRVYVVRICL